jgi:hypothetical protein
MNKEYKIRAFDKLNAQVVIEYENLPPMAIDLPVLDDGHLPTGGELDTHIKSFLPVWHVERLEKIKLGVNSDDVAAIENLVEPLPLIAPTNEQIAAEVRRLRDSILAESDWTQLEDAPFSETQKAAWATYRQNLRNLPEQSGFPDAIIWPETPKE